MNLDVYDDDHLLSADDLAMVKDLVEFAGKHLHLAEDTEMSITFVSKERIRAINKKYRDVDRATDVISFAIEDGDADSDFGEPLEALAHLPRNIGDLFISPGIAQEQADRYGHSFRRELGYTTVHGFLHLNGYDHIKKADEAVMIPLQEEILEAYGLTR
ncbi:rRNA maturation RNase YbeY [Schleiferilactobacillus shenzhenensis]|uniref:rRNA maturation RNase YbeY n=1 Tax=Schleiferilactobacillus shenzhenensis TaxID=1231337 RepID=UPI000402FBF0|nr:rRNA maturation RNase YbeY [Schleiferilactobacillus shenzhenensis]